MKNKLVIFDFDGVLIDTLSLWYSINQKTNPDLSFDEYSKMSYSNFYASFQSENPTVKFIPNPTARDEYHMAVREFDTPIEIQNAIRNFSNKYYLAIVSSGSETSICHFLEKENLCECFDDILGFETHKSKVSKLKQLLEKYSIAGSDAVFITDTLGDILEAHEAGIKSIGETWGLHDRETLSKGKPEVIIDDPAILEETIEKILN